MPRNARTHAVIVVRSARAFAWLGHMPIMNWSVKRLGEVRGIDTVTCVADARLVDRARKLLAKEEIEVDPLPAALGGAKATERDLDNWLVSAAGPAAAADVVLVVRPTSPFMPAAKVEAVLDLILSGTADTACTARQLDAYVQTHAQAAVTRLSAYAEVSTCRAFAPARRQERGIGRFKPVTLDLVESLDVAVPDNLRVAEALVATGKV